MSSMSLSLRDLVGEAVKSSSDLKNALGEFDKFRASADGDRVAMSNTLLPIIDSQRAAKEFETDRSIGSTLAITMSHEAKALSQFIDTVINTDGNFGVNVADPSLDPLGCYEQRKQSFETSEGLKFEKFSIGNLKTSYSVALLDGNGKSGGEELDVSVNEDGKWTVTNFRANCNDYALQIADAGSLDDIAKGEPKLP